MDSRNCLLLINGGVSLSLLAAESPGKEVQDVLKRLVAGVAGDIDALPDRPEDRVHDIRVGMKKFRAVLRLAEPSLKRSVFLKADKLARDLKDHFGSMRDDDVHRELLLDLLDKREALEVAAALGLSHKGDTAWKAADVTARGTCEALAALVGSLDLGKLTKPDILEAWVNTYRNTRRAMRACRKDEKDDFLFHEWRKRVKEILYQSATIGAPLDAAVAKTDRLSSVLGSQHDLAVLSERLSGHFSGMEASRAAISKKKMVARRALGLGRKLFSEKPSVLYRRVSRL